MQQYLISIIDLPPAGKIFNVDDQDVWLDSLDEFKIDCKIVKPMNMTVTLIPAENGCLVRGSLTGTVVVPCNRCAENAEVVISSNFEEFEDTPGESDDNDFVEESHVVIEKGIPMLDLSAIAWEQFMLAMPLQPLCKPDCLGLCPQCGVNLNLAPCNCEKEHSDPRLAVLRDLKIVRK